MIEAKLTCSAGPALGAEFLLKGEDLVVGRSPDNAVTVADASVSRRHVQLTKAVDGWRAKDLGSGNGTLLNGDRLDGEMPLRNGDILTLGNTQLTFQDLANSTDRVSIPPTPSSAISSRPPVPRRSTTGFRPEARVRVSRQIPITRNPGANRRFRLGVLGVLLFIAVSGVGLLILRHVKQLHAARVESDAARRIRLHEELSVKMQEGKSFARDGDWKHAVARFEEVRAVDPDFPELGAYLERAPKELDAQTKLEAAKKAMDAGKLGEAANLIAEANGDSSLYSPRIHSLQAMLERLQQPRLTAAKTALAGGDLEQAQSLISDYLKAWPDDREAQAIAGQAEQGLSARHRTRPSGPTPKVIAVEPKIWGPAVQHYVDGDLSGAAALAKGCSSSSARCREMARNLEEFSDLHRKIDDLDSKGLKRLIQLDHEIGEGKPSRLVRPAALRLANTLYKQASGAKTSGDWARAKDLARQVLVLDPSNNGALAIQEQANRMVKELYFHAYSLQGNNAEEAIKVLHEVEDMTSPDDEFHRKAQKLIERLSQ